MITCDVFTKEELNLFSSKYKFIYEPDVNKCKLRGIRMPIMFTTFYVKHGIVEYNQPGFATIEPYDKEWILKYLPLKYINQIYVEIFDQEDQNKLNDWNNNYHGHIWIRVDGHTPLTENEWIERNNIYESVCQN